MIKKQIARVALVATIALAPGNAAAVKKAAFGAAIMARTMYNGPTLTHDPLELMADPRTNAPTYQSAPSPKNLGAPFVLKAVELIQEKPIHQPLKPGRKEHRKRQRGLRSTQPTRAFPSQAKGGKNLPPGYHRQQSRVGH